MRWPDWEIGRVLGIPIRVHASWFVVFVFVTWTLATGYLPDSLPGLSPFRYWGMGGIAAVLLFGSVLLHELGHSYVALRYHIPIGQITLFIFGGVAHMRREPPGPFAEFLIAIAGPVVSFVLGALCLGLSVLAGSVASAELHGLVALGGLLGVVNVQLGLFNLIPGFPLDGGRVLRAGLWAWGKDFYRATGQAALVGLAFGLLLGLLGGWLIVAAATGALPGAMASNGGWVVFIGAFLFAAALGSRKQAMLRAALATVPVKNLMVQAVVMIPPKLSLEEAVNQYFLPYGYGGFPVVEDDRPIGLLTVREFHSIPPSLWTWRQVHQVMRPVSPRLIVTPDCSAMAALERMTQEDWDRLIVMEEDRIVGLVTRSAIAHFLQLRRP